MAWEHRTEFFMIAVRDNAPSDVLARKITSQAMDDRLTDLGRDPEGWEPYASWLNDGGVFLEVTVLLKRYVIE